MIEKGAGSQNRTVVHFGGEVAEPGSAALLPLGLALVLLMQRKRGPGRRERVRLHPARPG